MRALIRTLFALLVLTNLSAALGESVRPEAISLPDYLNSLNRQGLRVIYSSDIVIDEYRVLEIPNLDDPKANLAKVLRPFGLTVQDGPSGSLLVVALEAAVTSQSDNVANSGEEEAIAEIVITSSLHRLEYTQPSNHVYLDRELATRIPAAAEEAVRLANRLPGTASGGISARSYVRGGEPNETLFLLDGLRLYEPFHLKDFQSVATIVNSSAISGMDFYSGAFPARFGDRMSAVISMSLREPVKRRETELSLSFFNTSVLSLGRFGGNQQGNWLFAARRGNLDLIVDIIKPEFGNPDYQDFLGHIGWEFGPRTNISANFLMSVDKLYLADAARGEQANARYDNRIIWLKWVAEWTSRLRSQTVLSISDIRSSRVGSVALPGIVTASLNDSRAFISTSFKQDWTYVPSQTWMLSFGIDARHLDGKYVFSSTKAVFPPFDEIFDNQALVIRSSDTRQDGAQYAVYTELRWQLGPRLAMDAGLRWDHQNYTTAKNDDQTSPRLSLLFQANDRTELRIGWGKYSQAQEVNELQISDGSDSFFPAQRAEHMVVNLRYQFPASIDLNFSLYRKRFSDLRPRYENAFNQLTLVPEIQFDRVRIDAKTAASRGAEILFSRGSSTDKLLWWFGYVWAEVEDSTATGNRKRSWDQTHTAKFGASWRWGHWDFSAAGELHTGWPKTLLLAATQTNPDGSETLLLSTTELNTLRHRAYQTLDVRVSRDLKVRRGKLNIFLEITNLYNRSNPCCTEYSLADNNGASPTLLFRTADWLPLVPSLGIVWSF